MKTRLLRKVRRDAMNCWNSLTSITERHGVIVGLSYPSENGDVFKNMLYTPSPLGLNEKKKLKFMIDFMHRFWRIRKIGYYAKYSKAKEVSK